MQITPVINVLSPAGYAEPVLRALIPNEANYSLLLLQPEGHIEANAAGVRHADRDLAHRQFGAFLKDAVETNADLVVAPEYSMPWDTLIESIIKGVVPATGALWVLGCESIRYEQLTDVGSRLNTYATVIHEPLQQEQQRFLDPLAYVFLAPDKNNQNESRLVVLIQFKTHPMGDDAHFEINGMQRGSRIFEFGDGTRSLRMVSLICSDVFAFLDQHASAIYDRALILHVQLNPQPRQEQYRLYRDKLLQFNGDETELICLNWAKDVTEKCSPESRCWGNIAASAWYLRPNKFDSCDATLSANHAGGLYYTWCKAMRAHVLFFNYDPASYLLTATKVAHIAVSGSMSRRKGPTLSKRQVWDSVNSKWIDSNGASDGFDSVVHESRGARANITNIAAANPIAAERILALCGGKIASSYEWHFVQNIDSCGIDKSEVVYRMTYCQDTDRDSRDFRIERLKQCARLWDILSDPRNLPTALSDINKGFQLDWQPTSPHQNVISNDQRRATVIYMGEGVNESQVETTAKRVAEYIHRSFTDPDSSDSARQRLAVWYRDDSDNFKLFDPTRYLRYDDPRTDSEFDIARPA